MYVWMYVCMYVRTHVCIEGFTPLFYSDHDVVLQRLYRWEINYFIQMFNFSQFHSFYSTGKSHSDIKIQLSFCILLHSTLTI